MASAGTAELRTRGSKGLDQLDGEAEKVQFSALVLTLFRPYEELFHYRRDGQVDDWTWESVSSVCSTVMGTPGFRDWWKLRQGWFSSEFRSHVEEALPDATGYRRFDEGAGGQPS